ncbi:DUF4859 domain-containing protein [Fulvivirga sediminis]|uniref:DUF4859 domain-containing protein n=1 Tax=Fulvivirga sediminis TaxID=2803949 RepID=A0A937F8T7_9BACT|nr:DUF4859 domain-containing protein [Fulvivirga sediminis]MBL3657127.1 DUF4859 domain-containing protein [Fulvivirga sediminis]
MKFKDFKNYQSDRLTIKMIVLIFSFFSLFSVGCQTDDDLTQDVEAKMSTQAESAELLEQSALGIYIPYELRNNNFNSNSSQWYYGRSRESEHFIVFWDTEYGNNDPNSRAIPSTYRVDIDDLLEKAEEFYALNINTLKFARRGVGESNLDQYKMMIFIYYQDEWLATGSGYDDTIGALWVSPSTCQPVGSTIAHEIGHSFQYQVYSDLKGGSGFRYGFGGNGGNGFWEQTAQWQSFQSYPNEAFTSYHFPVYTENYHRHICHELYRYASYFIHYYWTDKHGIDFIGRLWREAQRPEDPLQAYMRITGISTEQLNNEIYDAASKFVTWDLDALRERGRNYIGRQTYEYTRLDDGSYQVTYDRCPGTTGYNVIPLNVPKSGTQITADFTGMVNAPGYNQVANPARAGWRYGFVALLADGTRQYGDMYQGTNNSASFTVPQNCRNLWFVVTGAPNTYAPHPWDEDVSNDDQWPYKVKFTNTDEYGDIVFDGTETQEDITITYNVTVPNSASNYTSTTIGLGSDLVDLAYAFVLKPNDITAALGQSVKFYGVESNGYLNPQNTANGYGHWFSANGNVIGWGNNAKVYSEFDQSNFSFTIGQYPGHNNSGDQYTIRQALVYNYSGSESVQATFVFNVTVE